MLWGPKKTPKHSFLLEKDRESHQESDVAGKI